MTSVLACYPLLHWSLLGMETGLLALFLLLSVHFALRFDERGDPLQLLYGSLSLCFAYGARPEGLVVMVPLLVFLARPVAGPSDPRTTVAGPGEPARPGPRRWKSGRAVSIGLFLLPLAAAIGGHTAFRWTYYGALVPNTYVLKVAGWPFLSRLVNGTIYTAPFLVEGGLLLLLAALGLAGAPSRRRWLVASVPLVMIAFQLAVGGDAFGQWRFLAPGMPLLFVLAPFGAVRLAGRLSAAFVLRRAALAGGLVLAALLALDLRSAGEILFVATPQTVRANRDNVRTALALRDVTLPEARLAVLWAGAIPYYAHRPAIDMLGKSDREIARLAPDLSVFPGTRRILPGHFKYDLDRSIVSAEPDYVQRFRWLRDDVTEWARERYVAVRHRGALLYLRKGSPRIAWERLSGEPQTALP
jgi:hypothetical protein